MITYNQQNPYIPDPNLVKEMAATVKIRCDHGKQGSSVFTWIAENRIMAIMRNQWTDEQGTWASFTIHDEQERTMFLLRWS